MHVSKILQGQAYTSYNSIHISVITEGVNVAKNAFPFLKRRQVLLLFQYMHIWTMVITVTSKSVKMQNAYSSKHGGKICSYSKNKKIQKTHPMILTFSNNIFVLFLEGAERR